MYLPFGYMAKVNIMICDMHQNAKFIYPIIVYQPMRKLSAIKVQKVKYSQPITLHLQGSVYKRRC